MSFILGSFTAPLRTVVLMSAKTYG